MSPDSTQWKEELKLNTDILCTVTHRSSTLKSPQHIVPVNRIFPCKCRRHNNYLFKGILWSNIFQNNNSSRITSDNNIIWKNSKHYHETQIYLKFHTAQLLQSGNLKQSLHLNTTHENTKTNTKHCLSFALLLVSTLGICKPCLCCGLSLANGSLATRNVQQQPPQHWALYFTTSHCSHWCFTEALLNYKAQHKHTPVLNKQ